MLVFVTFLTFKFWFHYFYILILYKVFGKHRLGSSTIGKFGKTAFTTECLTVANTQFECVYPHIFSQHIFKITPSRCQDPLTYLMEFLQKKPCLPSSSPMAAPFPQKGPSQRCSAMNPPTILLLSLYQLRMHFDWLYCSCPLPSIYLFKNKTLFHSPPILVLLFWPGFQELYIKTTSKNTFTNSLSSSHWPNIKGSV